MGDHRKTKDKALVWQRQPKPQQALFHPGPDKGKPSGEQNPNYDQHSPVQRTEGTMARIPHPQLQAGGKNAQGKGESQASPHGSSVHWVTTSNAAVTV
jgi:hypothetical protein